MSENNSFVEIFEEESIITLFNEENKPVEFYEIASIEYEGKFYELMQPVNLTDGFEEGEAVILEYNVDEEKDEKTFSVVSDTELLEKVFALYLKEVADNECVEGCGCSCEDCHHH